MHFVVGYGSLLSDESRRRFSDIHCHPLPVTVTGWRRAWITRSFTEYQTYVGATAELGAVINGALVPIDDITPDLQKREQDYTFEPVTLAQLTHATLTRDALSDYLDGRQVWLCQSRHSTPAEHGFPVYQSYLDTCLLGCLEAGGEDFAKLFLSTTDLLQRFWIDDRSSPCYPRAALPSEQTAAHIDTMLSELGLLQHRREQV